MLSLLRRRRNGVPDDAAVATQRIEERTIQRDAKLKLWNQRRDIEADLFYRNRELRDDRAGLLAERRRGSGCAKAHGGVRVNRRPLTNFTMNRDIRCDYRQPASHGLD